MRSFLQISSHQFCYLIEIRLATTTERGLQCRSSNRREHVPLVQLLRGLRLTLLRSTAGLPNNTEDEMKKLPLLILAVGFTLFPSTALAQSHDEVCVSSRDQECEEPPQNDCKDRCPVYINILPTTTTTAAPSTTTTAAPTTTTAEVLGEQIVQPPAPSDPGVLPITGGDVLGLTAIGVAFAAIGLGLTRARRNEAQ